MNRPLSSAVPKFATLVLWVAEVGAIQPNRSRTPVRPASRPDSSRNKLESVEVNHPYL